MTRATVESDAAPYAAPRRPLGESPLALAAFTLSMVTAAASLWVELRGPEIYAAQPRQLLMYRDGEGDRAVLTLGLRIDLINQSSGDFGDVLTAAWIRPGVGAPRFEYQATGQAVFVAKPSDCALGARCVNLPGLQVIEQPDDIIALPGGSAVARQFLFPLDGANCHANSTNCKSYDGFNTALRTLANTRGPITIHLSFRGDGERELICRTAGANGAYLRAVGWVSMACEETNDDV